MNAQSITNALLHLRAQIVRNNVDGLLPAQTRLIARDVDPASCNVKTKRKPDAARSAT